MSSLLRAGANIDCQPAEKWRYTPLALAARNYNCTADTVRFLLGNGADIALLNGKRTPDAPPLVWAAHGAGGGDANEKFRLLFAAGANVNAYDKHVDKIGRTVLWEMTGWANAELLEDILKRGANPNLGSLGGRTPLHIAALGGRADAVVTLLRYAANPFALDEEEQTPRMLAENEKILWFGDSVARSEFGVRDEDQRQCAQLLLAAEQKSGA